MSDISDAFEFGKNRGENGRRAEEYLERAERALQEALDDPDIPAVEAGRWQRVRALQAQAQIHATLEVAEHVWELRHYFPDTM